MRNDIKVHERLSIVETKVAILMKINIAVLVAVLINIFVMIWGVV